MDDETRAHLAAARESLDREDFAGALARLEKVREVDANTVEVLHERAYAHIGLGEMEEALECYDAAVRLGTEDADLWNDRAFTLLDMGRFAEAEESAGRALELDPGHYAALCNLSKAELELGRSERALEMADRAVALDPLEEEGIFLRAESARRLGRREEAVAAYAKVLKVNPHNTQAAYRLEQLEHYREMQRVRRWDGLWERWSGLERLPFILGFLLPGILLVALGALVPTIKGGNVLLFRAISISVGGILILISAAVMLSGRGSKAEGKGGPGARAPEKPGTERMAAAAGPMAETAAEAEGPMAEKKD
ncbi:MAG: tetratricopeptide repeat protein [Euryarchaeota archaeon]|nr:tetratricopeptide repeat protein [Euryarchaeota archaeon]